MAALEIFCDFDGTITLDDCTDRLLEELAHPDWRKIETRWEKGLIGSAQCMKEQVELISGGWPAMCRVLDTIKIDPTFPPFAAWCAISKIPLHVISDGIDKVISCLFEREGIKVDSIWSNTLVHTGENGLSLCFPHASPDTGCASGICKCRIIGGSRSVKAVIGDSRSDFCWANEADLLFAKKKLLAYCLEEGLPHIAFQDFSSIRRHLEEHVPAGKARP